MCTRIAVTAMFSDIALRKIAMLIPLLGSDKDGEVLAAARKLRSVLTNEAKDFHDLVKAVSATPTVVYETTWSGHYPWSQKQKTHQPAPNKWLAKAQFCFDARHDLSPREAEFVSDMTVKMRLYAPSEKQAAWLEAIYERIKMRTSA